MQQINRKKKIKWLRKEEKINDVAINRFHEELSNLKITPHMDFNPLSAQNYDNIISENIISYSFAKNPENRAKINKYYKRLRYSNKPVKSCESKYPEHT